VFWRRLGGGILLRNLLHPRQDVSGVVWGAIMNWMLRGSYGDALVPSESGRDVHDCRGPYALFTLEAKYTRHGVLHWPARIAAMMLGIILVADRRLTEQHAA